MAVSKSRQKAADIRQVILRSVNPFDPTTFKPGNFWQEDYKPNLEVDSIHQDVVEAIEQSVAQIGGDRVTRTLLLQGGSGSGKSYLLGRVKKRLNDRAFFVYIGPWPDSEHIWRHTLRNTIDSLVQTAEGQSESQLLQWLNRLVGLQQKNKPAWVAKGRSGFVKTMRAANPSGLYNSSEFFGVLYSLTQPELYGIACDWLKGDDLSEEDLKLLKVKESIESENTAQKVLSNLGRIAKSTLPIVLCFDQLDNIPKLANDAPDIQALMNVNSTLHNEKLKNFLVIISVITNTWRQTSKLIQPADLARVGPQLKLKNISLDQAEAIWVSRLYGLHRQAEPKPESAIAPLTRALLEAKFPGGKTQPRTALMVGQQLIEHFKRHRELPGETKAAGPGPAPPPPPDLAPADTAKTAAATFKLLWDDEFRKAKQRVRRFKQFSSPELIQRLREALEALDLKQVETSFLSSSKYAANSLSFKNPVAVGVVWAEEPNMRTFCYLMKACRKALKQQDCEQLLLVRAESVGNPKNKGNQLYQAIFDDDQAGQSRHLHLKPDLASLYSLETYHQLVNSACSHELVVGQEAVSLEELQDFVRKAEVLNECPLLQELLSAKRVSKLPKPGESDALPPVVIPPTPMLDPMIELEKHLRNVITTQHLIGRAILFDNAKEQFGGISEAQFDQLLKLICKHKFAQLVNPNDSLDQQLICLVPT